MSTNGNDRPNRYEDVLTALTNAGDEPVIHFAVWFGWRWKQTLRDDWRGGNGVASGKGE